MELVVIEIELILKLVWSWHWEIEYLNHKNKKFINKPRPFSAVLNSFGLYENFNLACMISPIHHRQLSADELIIMLTTYTSLRKP